MNTININTILNAIIAFSVGAIMFILRDIRDRLYDHEKVLRSKVDKDECRDYRAQICAKIDVLRRD